jgi:hypothetical protein
MIQGAVKVQSEVRLSSLPPLAARIEPKNKIATDSTDSKDLALPFTHK